MTLIEIDHHTQYHFSDPVELAPHRLVLRPRDGFDLLIQSSLLSIEPTPDIYWHRDAFDNSIAMVVFHQKTEKLSIRSRLRIEQYRSQTLSLDNLVPVGGPSQHSDNSFFAIFLEHHLTATELPPSLRLQQDVKDGAKAFLAISQLTETIKASFNYEARENPGIHSAQQTLSLGYGSCRDFAWLMIEIVRCFGYPARFVSGYFMNRQFQPEEGATHAWLEVYLPQFGWLGFDPTVGRPVGPEHIAVAAAPSAEPVSPITGSFKGAADTVADMRVSVLVSPARAPENTMAKA